MKVKLAYGKRGLVVNIPDGYHTDIIEPHFFMGFSGGGKAVMPGMGLLHTIRYIK